MSTNDNVVTKRPRTGSDEHPYARYAFWNPYNISLFLGGIVLGVATDNGWISVLTCAAEVLWMIFAPDSKLLRGLWFDRAFTADKRADDAERREARVAQLAPYDSSRLAYLCGQKQIIERLARDNPSLTVELLTNELAKLDQLLDDFVELGITASRSEQHTTTFDFRRDAPQLAHLRRAAPPASASAIRVVRSRRRTWRCCASGALATTTCAARFR